MHHYLIRLVIAAISMTLSFTASANAEKKLVVCSGCHGVESSTGPDIPNLAGQNAEYIYNQVQNFRDGTRKDFTMSMMVEAITNEDIKIIADHYSTLTPAKNKFDAKLAAKGKPIFVNTCSACHGEHGEGVENIARTGRQKAVYLVKQLKAFKSGARDNEVMREVASQLSDDDIKAIAEYESSL